MSLTLNLGQFAVIPEEANLGDVFTFVVTGRLNKLEQDEVDVTRIGSRYQEFAAGSTEARLTVLAVERSAEVQSE